MCYRSHSPDSAVDASITFQLSLNRKSFATNLRRIAAVAAVW